MTIINKKDNRHQAFVMPKQYGNFLGFSNSILEVKAVNKRAEFRMEFRR